MEQYKEPETDSHSCAWLIFTEVKKQFNGERIIFSTNNVEAIGIGREGEREGERKTEIHPKLHSLYKRNSKWITDITVKPSNFGEKAGEKLWNL
jgi:hypothetical protein